MPRLSIITAAYAPLADFIGETVASVQDQELPDGWDLEWLVQEDGTDPRLGDELAPLPHVSYEANNAHTGIAATRNQALSRATGDLVQILDHDDVLLPGAILNVVQHFDDPSIHWAVGQADDLMPGGERITYESALPFGRVPSGTVNDWAIKHDANWPIHCAGLTMRTQLVRILGGWAGCPVDDDIILFSALSEIADGYNEPATTWLYRRHQRQTHKSNEWKARNKDGRRIALQRVQAVRAARLHFSVDHLAETPVAAVRVGAAAKDTAADGHAWWKEQ